MDEMTDFQFVKLLQMVLEILKASKTLDEAEAKIERLMSKGAQKKELAAHKAQQVLNRRKSLPSSACS